MTEVDDDRRHHLDVPEVAHRLLRLLEECSAEPRVLEPGVDREHAEVAVIAVLLDEHTSDERPSCSASRKHTSAIAISSATSSMLVRSPASRWASLDPPVADSGPR